MDFGGGATPRHRDDPHIILNSKGAKYIDMSSSKFKGLIKKFEYQGKIDLEDFNSVAEMTQFLDFYNNTIQRSKQSEHDRMITDMNEYYYKLWIRAIDEMR